MILAGSRGTTGDAQGSHRIPITMTHRIASALAVLLLPQVAQTRPRTVRGNPLLALPKGSPTRLVFGDWAWPHRRRRSRPRSGGRLERLGAVIARRGDVVLTGACPGMPQVTARAAKLGGLTVGISPVAPRPRPALQEPDRGDGRDQDDGRRGRMGFIARERDNIAYSDILVFAGGRSGTLGELLFAMQERKVIALLEDSTGVTEKARREILPYIGRGKGLIVTDRDPDRLIAKAVKASERLKQRDQREQRAEGSALRRCASEPRATPRFPGPGQRPRGRRAPARVTTSTPSSATASG